MRRAPFIMISIGCILLLPSPQTHAQTIPAPTFEPIQRVPEVDWWVVYDGPGIDRAASMALHPDGSLLYVTGESYGERFSMDYLTLAFDTKTGALFWSNRYETPWGDNDSPTHVAVSPDGRIVFVTGTSIGWGADEGMGTGPDDADWDFVTLAYDAGSGKQLWEQRYHGHQRGDGWTNSLAVAPDSSTVVINGRSSCMDDPATPQAEPGNATIAYDAATGERLWVACFEGSLGYGDFGSQLAISGDSTTVILTGTRLNPGTGYDYATMAFDIGTGKRRWLREYDNGLYYPDVVDGTDPTLDSPRAIAASADGSVVYVTGISRGEFGLVDYVTLAYEVSSGAQRGYARFDGALQGHDRAHAIAVSPDGSQVFVTGESQTAAVGREVVTIAYTEDLRRTKWQARHNTSEAATGLPDSRDDIGRLIAVSDDGRKVVVGGDSWGADLVDWMFVEYDAWTGEKQWSGLYDGVLSHADFFRGQAVNADASMFFVTGHSCSCGTSGLDILTMGIRVGERQPSGEAAREVWPRRVDRGLHEIMRQR